MTGSFFFSTRSAAASWMSAAAVGIDEKEILGSYSAAVDIQEAGAGLVLQKKLPVLEIVTHRFPLARIQEGLDLAARPTEESLKILITHV